MCHNGQSNEYKPKAQVHGLLDKTRTRNEARHIALLSIFSNTAGVSNLRTRTNIRAAVPLP